MNILFISSELYPYAKVGGLGDVSAALPQVIRELGHDISVFVPFYKNIDRAKYDFELILRDFKINDFNQRASVYKHYDEDKKIANYFIGCEEFFHRDEIYGNYDDNNQRFIFFSKAILKSIKELNISPDVIHCNDWQTAAIPILLKTTCIEDNFYKKVKILFTIHNLAFQGIGDKKIAISLGIYEQDLVLRNLEFWGKYNLMKGAILYSDLITTVSESYAKEIQTKEYGFGLEKELALRSNSIYGILNGIDYDVWNPIIDRFIWKKYGLNSLENKLINKIKLLDLAGFPKSNTPVIGMVTRLTSQKGLDLLIEILDELMNLNIFFIILGTGQIEYHDFLSSKEDEFPNKMKLFLEYNEELAHQIEAGADIFLMPSRFEPCGLNQMISLKYGTIPIVREIGGLKDSIVDVRSDEKGNGFSFSAYSSLELLNTIKESINYYFDKPKWEKLMRKAMTNDFSWKMSARKYEKLYKKLVDQ